MWLLSDYNYNRLSMHESFVYHASCSYSCGHRLKQIWGRVLFLQTCDRCSFQHLVLCFHAASLFRLHTTSILSCSICHETGPGIYGEHKKWVQSLPHIAQDLQHIWQTHWIKKKRKEKGTFNLYGSLEAVCWAGSQWIVLLLHVRAHVLTVYVHLPLSENVSICLLVFLRVCLYGCVCFCASLCVCVCVHWIRLLWNTSNR